MNHFYMAIQIVLICAFVRTRQTWEFFIGLCWIFMHFLNMNLHVETLNEAYWTCLFYSDLTVYSIHMTPQTTLPYTGEVALFTYVQFVLSVHSINMLFQVDEFFVTEGAQAFHSIMNCLCVSL